MKLLIVTQKVDRDDQVLGFFHNWILEFSKQVESIVVICLEKGSVDLPENVRVLSLGKENGKNRLKYLFRFYKHILSECKNYDNVFVHMNQIYVILGSCIWKMLGKRIGLWYAHGSVSLSLRIATLLVNDIFTSSLSGFRLKSKKASQKIRVVGQGIDTEMFKLQSQIQQDVFKENSLLTIGRISRTKKIDLMILALSKLSSEYILKIIGDAITNEDRKYYQELKDQVKELGLIDRVIFLGSKKQAELPEYLNSSKIFINLSQTGSLDKAVLEAMSCNMNIITANEAYSSMIPDSYINEEELENIDLLVSKIESIGSGIKSVSGSDKSNYREIVLSNHSLPKLVGKIVEVYKSDYEGNS